MLVLFMGPCLWGEVSLEKIRVNGFLSQAYMKSTKNNFLTRSKKGSFQINELGLTISMNLTNKLRLGFQLFSRDLGDLGNNRVVLDWGFADYRVSNALGIRVGKVKAPLGLYNEGRDTDFLRPMAFLPQGTYAEAYRGFIVAYQGIGLYGNLFLGDLGDLEYHGYVGIGNIAQEETLVRSIQADLNNFAPITGIIVTDLSVENRISRGMKVAWNTPLTGLKLAVSNLYMIGEFLLHPGAPKIGQLKIPHWWLFSLEYMTGNLTVAAEYNELNSEVTAFGVTVEDQTNQAYYVMLSYMITPKLTLTGLVDIYYDNKADKKGARLVAQGYPDYQAWRKDLGCCLRYDVNKHWTVKAEWHSIDGAALYVRLYNLDGYAKNWNYFIFKTSFSF